MGSGVKYRRKQTNYVKIGVIALISLPILYLIFNWATGNSSRSFHQQMFSKRRPVDEPHLVKGKL